MVDGDYAVLRREPAAMLTSKQRQLLLYIDEKIREDGVSPSFDEMKEALELASKSGIHRLITALEERGFLRRLPHRARALEVVKLPEDASASSVSNVGPAMLAANDVADVPLLGRIAAGTPKSAIETEVDRVPLPPNLVGRGQHFALQVQGESMIDKGINDGDIVFIKKAQTAMDGDIVVAFIPEREEATLKILHIGNDQIVLRSANPLFEDQIYKPGEVSIQGKLVGLTRNYG